MNAEEREAKIREITERLAERLRQQWPDEHVPLSEIEDVVGRVGGETLRELTEEMLQEQVRRREGNQSACPCGGWANFRGYYGLTIASEHGPVRLERAYFYCGRCRQGQCPVDRLLGLGPAATTPAVQAKVTALAARIPYTQVPTVLTQLGLPYVPCIKSVEAIAQRLGMQLEVTPAVPNFGRAERDLAIAVDGIFLPTRNGSREVRCAVLYEPLWDAERNPTACAGLRKEYVATSISREALLTEACARLERRRPRGAVVAALGDGAESGALWALGRVRPEGTPTRGDLRLLPRLRALGADRTDEAQRGSGRG